MTRSFGATLAACVAAVAIAGCTSSSTPTPPPPAGLAIEGTWAVCRWTGGADEREVHVFQGSTFENRSYMHGPNDGSCSGAVVLDDLHSGSGTFSWAGTVQVADPDGAGSVTASAVDVVGTPMGTMYTILYLDTRIVPNLLYFGDIEGANDGWTPETRHSRLQSQGRPKIASAPTFPAIASGAFAACRPGFTDELEVLVFSGGALESWTYEHPDTSDGSCGGRGVLVGGGQTALTFGPEVVTSIRTLEVRGREVDIHPQPAGSPYYTTMWFDGLAGPTMLYLGDDSGADDGSSPALRPRSLRDWDARYLTAYAAPAYPADLTGSWDRCTTEQRETDTSPTDYQEILSFQDPTFISTTWRHSTTDGTCGNPVSQEWVGGGTFAIVGSGAASLEMGDDTWSVTARHANVSVTWPPTEAKTFYTIVYIDRYASPPVLYTGDERAPNDGSTPALRPTVLQPVPRYKL